MTTWFVDPSTSDGDGVVAITGEITAPRILEAYRHGVFPFYYEGSEVQWRSPDPRAVIPISGLHVSRSLIKAMKRTAYEVRWNTTFRDVITACAADRPASKSWLTAEVIDAYGELHTLGWAQSIELWVGGALAGGVYGVAIGAFFSAESMFSRIDNGSKIALYHLMEHLKAHGYQLCDIQFLNPHTRLLGGLEISRREYLARLHSAIDAPVAFVAP